MPESSITYGLLGQKLGHSWSPQIHRMLGSAPYELIEATPQDVASILARDTWSGLNVTIPYKRQALLAADTASDAARAIGAANTLIRLKRDGSIYADNTDAAGFLWLLERFSQRQNNLSACAYISGKKVLVLGAQGGAGRAVCYALQSLGAHSIGVSRTEESFHHNLCSLWIPYGRIKDHSDAALIVNCTPVGMYPNCPKSPLAPQTLDSFTQLEGVIDVIYNPLRSALLLAALKRGIPAENGLGMLVAQACAASRLFLTGEPVSSSLFPVDFMTAADSITIEAIEQRLVQHLQNIVLIGMPGVGKTSAGQQLARLCGRPFVDIDAAVQASTGKTPTQIIRESGEEAFRAAESAAVKAAGLGSGHIIACGGGTVVTSVNYEALKQNGHLVFLDRPIHTLDTKNRPLTAAQGLESIARARMPLYLSWADTLFACTGSPATDAAALKTLFSL